MQELIEALSKLSTTMTATKKTLEAQIKVNEGKFKSVEEAIIQRSIEDGIINNLHNASEKQLDKILDSRNRTFRYYEEFYKEIEFIKIGL